MPAGEVERALASLPRESLRAAEWLQGHGGKGGRHNAWRTLLQRGFSVDTAESIVGDADCEDWAD